MSDVNGQREERSRVFAHIIVPGLSAAVEAQERGGKGQEVALCDPTGQRVVSASPAARCRGVRAGASRWEAMQRCPALRLIQPNSEKYHYFWQRVLEICGDYTPHLLPYPDRHELTLDLTGTERLFGSARSVTQEIRNRLRGELGLEAALGLGPNAMVARLAARQAHPGEVIEITPQAVTAFVGRLPVAALPGVDVEWARWLGELGIRQASDFAALSAEAVTRAFGARGRRVWEIARGRDPDEAKTRHEQVRASRAIDRKEETVSAHVELRPATEERARIRAALRVAAEEAERRLRQRGEAARQIRVEIVLRDLRRIELQRTLPHPTRSSEVLCRVARTLYDHVRLGSGTVRRVRIHAAGLTLDEHGGQLPLPLLDREARRERLAEMVERVRDRFGQNAMKRANAMSLSAR